jgi:hypothetical protein
MPMARKASFGTSEKVTVAIGSTSSNMRCTLACGCVIGGISSGRDSAFVDRLSP